VAPGTSFSLCSAPCLGLLQDSEHGRWQQDWGRHGAAGHPTGHPTGWDSLLLFLLSKKIVYPASVSNRAACFSPKETWVSENHFYLTGEFTRRGSSADAPQSQLT